MTISLQETINNWHHLIKNRKGPYHLVLKDGDGDNYFGMSGYRKPLSEAYTYETLGSSCWPIGCQIFVAIKMICVNGYGNYKMFITTAAGDIEVRKSDFNSKVSFI